MKENSFRIVVQVEWLFRVFPASNRMCCRSRSVFTLFARTKYEWGMVVKKINKSVDFIL